jgi:hypothetical protein
MSEIIKTAEDKISTLKCNDVVILWGEANDISRNNTKTALKYLSSFMNANKEVNIVLINSPHRHDLIHPSCVNKDVAKFNRQLRKTIRIHTNVKLLEADLHRKHFTQHGQHLNHCGKKLVSLELAKIIDQLFNEVHLDPICIQ